MADRNTSPNPLAGLSDDLLLLCFAKLKLQDSWVLAACGSLQHLRLQLEWSTLQVAAALHRLTRLRELWLLTNDALQFEPGCTLPRSITKLVLGGYGTTDALPWLPELAPLTNLRSLTLRSVVAAAAARSLPLLPSLERLQLEECVLPLPATLPALTWLCELSVLAAELPHPPQHHLLEAAMCEELLAACSRLQHLSSLVLQLPWAVRLDCMPILPQLQHFWWGGRAATGQLPPGWGSTLCMLAAPMHVVLALQQQLEASGMLHTLCTWEVQTEARLAALRQLAHLPSLRCMHLLHPKPPLPVDVPEVVSAHMHAGRVNMDDCLQRLFEVDNLHLPDISDDEI